jgi:hypothetical protein
MVVVVEEAEGVAAEADGGGVLRLDIVADYRVPASFQPLIILSASKHGELHNSQHSSHFVHFLS